jgi:hypothetical protein
VPKLLQLSRIKIKREKIEDNTGGALCCVWVTDNKRKSCASRQKALFEQKQIRHAENCEDEMISHRNSLFLTYFEGLKKKKHYVMSWIWRTIAAEIGVSAQDWDN